jgi:hypothetical protein
VTVDAANGGSDFVFNGLPHDWTEGTGVFPAGGVITIPSPTLKGMTRKWLFIQNQDIGVVTVQLNATKADGSTTTTASVVLAAAAGAGLAGGAYENFHQKFSVVGQLIITGTAGQKVLVLERLK